LLFGLLKIKKKHEKIRKNIISSLHRLPTNFGMLLSSDCRDKCKEIAKFLKNHDSMFILGKGFGFPIALEASLKIKEITYLHAEAYPSGSLKHGPFALIKESLPIFIILLNDEHFKINLNACYQVSGRKANLTIVTDIEPSELLEYKIFNDIVHIPNNGVFTAMLGVLVFQLIAYELSVLKGIDPDHPNNLAKVVTVL